MKNLKLSENDINNNLEQNQFMVNNLEIEQKQNNFLNSTIGKIINTGIDLGLRWIFPDFLENQIIDIKDSLIKGGLKDGINKTVTNSIELGKSISGIFTGKFESISQAQNAIKNGGIIDGISNVIDSVLNITTKNGILPFNISNMIRKGKNVILDNISNNIESEFVNELNSIEKLGKYENNWKEYFKNKNFEGMEREYSKIKDKMKEIMPIEKTIMNARIIENLHLIIKNNGHNFNLTQEQIELSKILIK